MSNSAKHPCARCGRLISGRCSHCRRVDDKARGSAQQRGYDKPWARYSREWLQRFPLCGQRADGRLYLDDSLCVQHVEHVRAEVVDHIVPIVAGGARFDPSNHQSLCRRCNAAKVNAADAAAIRARRR